MAREERKLDFAEIIFRQILAVMEARRRGDGEFVREVEAFDDLMSSHWFNDKVYEQRVMQINDDYKQKTRMLRPRLFFDHTALLQKRQVEKAKLVYRELIRLVNRSGFLPYREWETIVDDATSVFSEEEKRMMVEKEEKWKERRENEKRLAEIRKQREKEKAEEKKLSSIPLVVSD